MREVPVSKLKVGMVMVEPDGTVVAVTEIISKSRAVMVRTTGGIRLWNGIARYSKVQIRN